MHTVFKPFATSFVQSAKGINKISLAKMSSKTDFKTLSVTVPKPFVYHVELNRPDKLNAMNRTMWLEIGECFNQLHMDPECRAIILSGAGRMFTAGLDFKDAMQFAQQIADVDDPARKAKHLQDTIKKYQASMTSLELCNKPVISAVHNACIGGGINIITAADIRYCTKDAWYQVKEVIIGLAADVGVLQRLPKIVGSDSLTREFCYTGRKINAEEALKCGLVSKVFEDKESLIQGALVLAEDIAAKSPVAVQGTKRNLVYSRDHSVQDGLEYIATWNQLMLQSEDFATAVAAAATKQTDVVYSKL